MTVADPWAAGDCRVVYTDNDPLVGARGRQMLADVPGAAVVEADIREPDTLFGHPETRRLIGLTQPVGLLTVAVTQFVPDEDAPWDLFARHVDPLAPAATWRCRLRRPITRLSRQWTA